MPLPWLMIFFVLFSILLFVYLYLSIFCSSWFIVNSKVINNSVFLISW